MLLTCQAWKHSIACSQQCLEAEDASLVTRASLAPSLFRWVHGGGAELLTEVISWRVPPPTPVRVETFKVGMFV